MSYRMGSESFMGKICEREQAIIHQKIFSKKVTTVIPLLIQTSLIITTRKGREARFH